MSDPFIAEVRIFAGTFAPVGWAFCDGQLLPINQNTALFSLVGTIYGGDGRTTFGLPDMRGRMCMHPGAGPGLSPRTIGEKGGAENVTLDVTEIPAHGHSGSMAVNTNEGTSHDPTGRYLAATEEPTAPYAEAPTAAQELAAGSVNVGITGGSQPHDNMPPFLAMNFIIALFGIFPSRP